MKTIFFNPSDILAYENNLDELHGNVAVRLFKKQFKYEWSVGRGTIQQNRVTALRNFIGLAFQNIDFNKANYLVLNLYLFGKLKERIASRH